MPNEWYKDGLSFSCTQCGNCCSGPPGYVWFDEDESQAMAKFLGLDEPLFLRRFAHTVNGHWTLNERVNDEGNAYDCIFLRRDDSGKALCSIYSVRPKQCKTWPFWPENLQSRKAWAGTSQRCPGMKQGDTGQGKFYPIEQIRIIRDRHVS